MFDAKYMYPQMYGMDYYPYQMQSGNYPPMNEYNMYPNNPYMQQHINPNEGGKINDYIPYQQGYQHQQPIVQNNYINNFSFYPSNSYSNISQELLKAVEKNSKNESNDQTIDSISNEKTPKENKVTFNLESQKIYQPKNLVKKAEEVYDYSCFNPYQYNQYIPNNQTAKSEEMYEQNKEKPQFQEQMDQSGISKETQKDLFNSLCETLKNEKTDSNKNEYQNIKDDNISNYNLLFAEMSKKRFRQSDEYSNLQKRFERMSLNDSININDLNNDFVNYVYNYRFSVNDREDLNINNDLIERSPMPNIDPKDMNFSPFIMNKELKDKKISGEELKELKEEAENEHSDTHSNKDDEETNNFNYNNYYNSLFANKTIQAEK